MPIPPGGVNIDNHLGVNPALPGNQPVGANVDASGNITYSPLTSAQKRDLVEDAAPGDGVLDRVGGVLQATPKKAALFANTVDWFERVADKFGYGRAQAGSLAFAPMTLDAGVALLRWPAAGNQNAPFCYYLDTTASFLVALEEFVGAFLPPQVDFYIFVRNSGGSTISVFTALDFAGRTPLRYDASHASVPTLAAGETALIKVRTAISGSNVFATLQVFRLTVANQRRAPALIDAGVQGTTASVTVVNAIGDLILSIWPRVNLAAPALAAGFTNLATSSFDGTTDYSIRIQWRIATAANETIPAPAVTTYRPVYSVWRGVDPSTPFPLAAVFANLTGATMALPAAGPHTAPLLYLQGFVSANSGAWAIPAGRTEVISNWTNPSQVQRLLRTDPAMSIPSVNVTSPGASAEALAYAIALQGATL